MWRLKLGKATHVAQKLPALLKLFHTKAYQQVLMAGAMRPDSAGLRSISAKHLALSSQARAAIRGAIPMPAHTAAQIRIHTARSSRRLR